MWANETKGRPSEVTGSALGIRQSHEQTSEGLSESAGSGEAPVLALFTQGIESTETVNLYFPGDRRRVSLVFDTRTDAEKAKKDFDDGVCKIRGHEVHPTMAEQDRNGRLVWELVLDFIPVEILEQDISASVHGLHQPSATIMDDPFAHTEGFATHIHVRNSLSRIGPFRGWHRKPHNDPWAEEKAVAAFTLATNAAEAVEALRNKPITIGNRDIEVTATRLLRLKFRIPATLDGLVGPHIERKLHSTWREHNMRSQWVRGKGSRTLKLYSDDFSVLANVKDEMAALLEGTIVRTTDETILWVEEFNDRTHQVTRQPVLVKLKMIEQALGVKFVRDQTARRLIVFGTESQSKLASELACKAARPAREEIDPRTAHHWHRVDIEQFKRALRQYASHKENIPAQPATTQTQEEEQVLAKRPLFRKVISVPSHVASSSKEELGRLQRAVGRDANRPLSLFSPGPRPDPRAGGHEAPIFRKHVPKLSPYAKAFLDARLNPRYILSDKPRDLGEFEGVETSQSSSGETIRKDMRVCDHAAQPPPPAAKEHRPNPEGLKKLDELLNAMRSPSASLPRRGPPLLTPLHPPDPYPQGSVQPPRSARSAVQTEPQHDLDALKKLDGILNAERRDS
jgi:hypothetical protein